MTSLDRLAAQVGFLLEVDRLKSVLRRGYVADGSRRENTAEHSWTLALMASVLAEHAAEPVDMGRVTAMVVIHDIVEVDAGDTYIYDDAGLATIRGRLAGNGVLTVWSATAAPEFEARLRARFDEVEMLTVPVPRGEPDTVFVGVRLP